MEQRSELQRDSCVDATVGTGDGALGLRSMCPEFAECPRGHPLTDCFSPAADPLRILLQLIPPSPVQPVPASSLRKCPSVQPHAPLFPPAAGTG